MVWTEKASIYDECVHQAAGHTLVGHNLNGVKILAGATTPTTLGCSDDTARCLVAKYMQDFSHTETNIENVVKTKADFKPTNYREKSCESQEAACRANCHDVSSAIDQINLVAVHIELTPLECETQCAEIGKICAAFEKCSADYQQCEAATCAPKVGGPYKFDASTPSPTPPPPPGSSPAPAPNPWKFTDPHGKEFMKCKNGCLRNLESCFQSVGPACKPDAERQYCELPA